MVSQINIKDGLMDKKDLKIVYKELQDQMMVNKSLMNFFILILQNKCNMNLVYYLQNNYLNKLQILC